MSFKESELLKLQNRDPLSLKKLYLEYSDKIYNYFIIKLNGNRDLAEELSSETFCAAIDSINKLKNIDCLLSWLFGIASRKFYDYLRKQYREKKYLDKIEKEDTIDENDIIENLYTRQKVLIVDAAINKLKPNYKQIIELKYKKHKSQKEISDIINNSISAVENLLYKARKSLIKEIKKISKDF